MPVPRSLPLARHFKVGCKQNLSPSYGCSRQINQQAFHFGKREQLAQALFIASGCFHHRQVCHTGFGEDLQQIPDIRFLDVLDIGHAQELKTPVIVSVKRLEKVLAGIRNR